MLRAGMGRNTATLVLPLFFFVRANLLKTSLLRLSYSPQCIIFTCLSFLLSLGVASHAIADLPPPSLISPPNGGGNQLTTPTFIWSAVTGATSYRIMVATTLAALPTDPNASTCGAGCVINATPTTTFYIPAAGTLSAGTTYFWQVKARSPTQVGAWSSQWSFTTAFPPAHLAVGPPSLNFGNVQIGSCSTAAFAIQHVLGTGPASGTVSINPNPLSAFSIIAGSSFSLSNGQGVNVWVQFCPPSAQSFSGSAVVSSPGTIFDTSNTVTLIGVGFQPPPTTGTIQVNATVNGASWPGAVNYTVSGPVTFNGNSVPADFQNRPAGNYTLTYTSGGPSGATLSSITPSPTQTLVGGGVITFALNFLSIPIPTLTFTANPSTIDPGQPSTLSWSSTNTTSCTASGGWSGPKGLNGSEVVSPSSTTTYTLSCDGPGGSVPKSATVTVNPIAKSDLIVENLVVTPPDGPPGANVTVSFTIRNQGSGTANASTTNIRLNTSSSTVTPSDPLLAILNTPSILAGGTHPVNQDVTIPSNQPAGLHFVWVIADVDSTANQSDETNDKTNTAFEVQIVCPSTLLSNACTLPFITLYDDKLGAGVTGESENAFVRYNCTGRVYDGTNSICAVFQPGGELRLKYVGVIDPDVYGALTFAIRVLRSGGNNFSMHVLDTNGVSMGSVPISSYVVDGQLKPQWYPVWIPLRDIIGDNPSSSIGGIMVTVDEAAGMYFDEVRIVEEFAFPVDGQNPYTAPVSAIFDHDGHNQEKNGRIMTYRGQLAIVTDNTCRYAIPGTNNSGACTSENYKNYPLVGYMLDKNGTDFDLPINYDDLDNYTQGSKGIAWYDGHTGYDYYGVVEGVTPIRAAASGVVKLIECDTTTCWNYGQIEIDHKTSYTTHYLHLDKAAKNFVVGDGVAKGDIIGYAGQTSPAPIEVHLHFTVKQGTVKHGYERKDPYGKFKLDSNDIPVRILPALWEDQP